jgi:hypothetical protein
VGAAGPALHHLDEDGPVGVALRSFDDVGAVAEGALPLEELLGLPPPPCLLRPSSVTPLVEADARTRRRDGPTNLVLARSS